MSFLHSSWAVDLWWIRGLQPDTQKTRAVFSSFFPSENGSYRKMTINPLEGFPFRFQRKPHVLGRFWGLMLRLPGSYKRVNDRHQKDQPPFPAGELLHFMVILVVLCLSHINHHHSHILLMNSPCFGPPSLHRRQLPELLRVRRLSPRATPSSRSSAVTPPSESAPATKARLLSPEGSP